MGAPIDRPQFSPSLWQSPPQLCDASHLKLTDQQTLAFLDDCLGHFGPNSVVYISFGTFYGMSSRPDLIELLLHTLLESRRPFVYAVNKMKPYLSHAIKRRIEEAELAHMVDFSPQHHVLAHLATGWYLVRHK